MKTPITNFALDYNRAIADARNQMILLNIVRASNREPMHFTAMSSVEATLSVGAEAGTGFEFAKGPAAAYSPSITLSSSYAPTFTVVPLNTNDFATGILRPASSAGIKLFLSQGWRQELLAALLIERIECPDGRRIINDPARLTDFAGLRFATLPPSETASANPRPGAIGAEVRFEPALSGRFRLPVDASEAAKLLMTDIGDRYAITQLGYSGERALIDLVRQQEGQLVVVLTDSLRKECRVDAEEENAVPADATARASQVRVHFRSTESVIYYLGELTRKGVGGTPVPDSITPGGTIKLFDVQNIPGDSDAVRVTHRGKFYALRLPQDKSDDRSLTVLGFINQLIALQTSPESLSRSPSTIRAR